MQKIYLDQASTSFPKAPGTAEAVFRYMTECGCNIGRGGYEGAYSAEELVYDTRVLLCRLFGGRGAASDPKNVVFTKNVTESLNVLLKGLLRPGDHVIALTVTGKAYTSEGLAARIGQLRDQGRNVSFLIGGSLGLSGEAVARADEELSLSKLTLPHRLARLVLLEQLYRSFKILNHETYHK